MSLTSNILQTTFAQANLPRDLVDRLVLHNTIGPTAEPLAQLSL